MCIILLLPMCQGLKGIEPNQPILVSSSVGIGYMNGIIKKWNKRHLSFTVTGGKSLKHCACLCLYILLCLLCIIHYISIIFLLDLVKCTAGSFLCPCPFITIIMIFWQRINLAYAIISLIQWTWFWYQPGKCGFNDLKLV